MAERIWRAWWRHNNVPLATIESWSEENLTEAPIPFALVAHENGVFAGTASVIADDLDERPNLTPWVAAVWVEPPFRQRGVGRRLVDDAARACFALGTKRLYLNALPAREAFYVLGGWQPIEREVGPHGVIVFSRDAPTPG